MKKQEILDIAKELILISGKYSKIADESEKTKLLNIFNKYEKQLLEDNTKYSEVILWFITDLKSDLENNRILNIDNLNTDEYLENYLLIKNELKIYNWLILESSYRKIFNELNKKTKQDKKIISWELDKIIKNFNLNIKKINTKVIAQGLLIFTSFERKILKKYLLNLYNFLENTNEKNKILELIKIGNKLLLEVRNFSIEYYKKWNFNYKYIWFTNINWKSVLNDEVINSSKYWNRSWFEKKEYLKLIKSL